MVWTDMIWVQNDDENQLILWNKSLHPEFSKHSNQKDIQEEFPSSLFLLGLMVWLLAETQLFCYSQYHCDWFSKKPRHLLKKNTLSYIKDKLIFKQNMFHTTFSLKINRHSFFLMTDKKSVWIGNWDSCEDWKLGTGNFIFQKMNSLFQ